MQKLRRSMTYILGTIWILFFAVTAIAADVSGRWVGTLVAANGVSERFLLILEQDGTKVTGTAGANELDRHPIEKGTCEGDRLTFEVPTPEGTLAFDLTAKADQINGNMAFKRGDQVLNSAQVSVKRQ
jgi:hypothetical protein